MKINNTHFVQKYIKVESSMGLLLFLAVVSAMIVANTPLRYHFSLLLDTTVAIQMGVLISALVGCFVLKSQFYKKGGNEPSA